MYRKFSEKWKRDYLILEMKINIKTFNTALVTTADGTKTKTFRFPHFVEFSRHICIEWQNSMLTFYVLFIFAYFFFFYK